jgi:high-affinity iron transporter
MVSVARARVCLTTPVRVVSIVTLLSAPACTQPRESPTIEAGRTLYADNGCASCHGARGHGDGPIAKSLDRKPRDFRVIADYKIGADTSSIAWVIANGLTVGGIMPPFAHLTAVERQSMALFVVSLQERTPTPGTRP